MIFIAIILSIICFFIGYLFRKSIIGEVKKSKKLMMILLFTGTSCLIMGYYFTALYSLAGTLYYWVGNLL